MSAIKKGTKLTDNPKDYMLRVRLDAETLNRLDEICVMRKSSRSKIVRNCISKLYQELKEKNKL